MHRYRLLRGVSASALGVVCAFSAALAQEALPTIDIDAEGASASGPARAASGQNANDSGTSYTGPQTTSSTKTGAPILDTPKSVQIVPKQVLQDNQVLNVQEAVKFVSGVQTAGNVFYDRYLIRGFNSNSNTYRNNLKLLSAIGTEDVAFLDRVEIVKGPNAMLFGRIQPGGLVNFVTKRPQEEAAHSIQEQFGSWGLSRTTIDSTGPLNDDKSLLYRFIGVFDHADDFINFRHRNNGALMGALTWRPTSEFEANVQVEYYNQSTTNRGYYGQQIPAVALSYKVPWIVGRPANLPRNWTQNVADMYSHYPDTMERILVYGDWSYKFNDDWKVTNRFHYSHQEEDQEYVIANGLSQQTGNLARYIGFYEEVSRDTYSLNLDVTGKVYTGDLQHSLLIGFDYYDYHAYAKGDDPFNGNTKGAVPTFNIFAPYYSGVAWPVIDAERYIARGNNLGHTKQLDVGYYIQDDISYNDTVHLLLGGRYDVAFDADAEVYGQRDTACFPICDGHYNPPWKGNKTERKFSPNAGLLFKITPEFSLYSSYSKSFANSNVLSRSFDNKPFRPEEAWQYEIGGKASLFEGRVTASIAAFELHRTNALSNDPAHPGFSVASGEVRSRGIEGDIAGRVTDNVSLIGSYTYDDAIIIRSTNTGTSSQLGKRWPGVPRHSGNLWAKYDTAPDRPEGWTFGAGFYAVGLRQGNPTNSWAMPGYVRFDTMIGYRTVFQSVPVEAQLNVVNIGDAKYFEAGNGSYAYYGQPRTFIGSVKVKF